MLQRFKYYISLSIKVLCLFFIVAAISAYKANSYLRAIHYKGNVKSLISYHLDIANDTISKQPSDKLIEKFDRKGNCVASEQYRPNDYLDKTFYQYNEHNLLIKRVYILLHKNDTIKVVYDTHTYDVKGREIEFSEGNSAHSLTPRITYNYNIKGDTVFKTSYNDLGKVRKVESLEYYAKSKEIKQFDYKHKGNLLLREIYGKGYKSVYWYNKEMKLVEYDHYRAYDTLDSKSIMLYNKHGSIIAENKYNLDSLIQQTIHNYTYDKTHNWIIDSVFMNGKLTHIKKQEFEYY